MMSAAKAMIVATYKAWASLIGEGQSCECREGSAVPLKATYWHGGVGAADVKTTTTTTTARTMVVVVFFPGPGEILVYAYTPAPITLATSR